MFPRNELTRKAYCYLTELEADQTHSSVDKNSNLDNPHRKDWLAVAQKDMTNVEKIRLASELVGKLHGLMMSHSKKENGDWDIYDEDAIAFAQAFKDALVKSRSFTMFSD